MHYFPYDVKLRLLAHSQSFLANQKARNAIVGAENLLKWDSSTKKTIRGMCIYYGWNKKLLLLKIQSTSVLTN